jgi:cellulose synthase/poly-beta-1,6-N-acetylglucosamine synthase-like glycosyltransferase
MVLRYDALRRILPLKKCKSEDSYISFKVLEQGGRIAFCEDCCVETVRTASSEQEEGYKRRTTGGIYQALSMTKPPAIVRLFYTLLPFISPLLLLAGKKGYYWSKGILLGYTDYIRGDRSGAWKPSY